MASGRVFYVQRKSQQLMLLIKVLLKEFQSFFIIFICSVTTSALLIYSFYPRADLPHERLGFMQTVYDVWLMLFFESPLTYVDDWRIAPLFFLLPLLGLVTIAEGVVHLGNLLFQHQRYSGEWQKMIASTFENHIVVCGLGNVGVRVVQHLRQFDETVTVIESNAESRFVNEVAGIDVPVLMGDARDSQMLMVANIHKAKAIIAVTDNDLVNLEAVLTARELNPNIRVVVRMFDQKMAKKIEKNLGIHGAYSSSARSARLFAQAAISGDIIDSFEFGGTTINAIQIVVESNTALVGQTVDDVRHQHEVTVLLHEKAGGEVDWNPSPNNILAVGDKLLIMTDRLGLKRLEPSTRKLTLPQKSHD
ncbi:MAG: TrkA family potassium uptake protein [Candidatus Obscuribacterales bacterium]|nr:TrkA family potassium uptake protein [Cyanobacteria bacterium SZAS LIN-5]RTL39232.1 MAG: TrkA family potassium uptake protein [Candidatus Melainabacteria bacterium]